MTDRNILEGEWFDIQDEIEFMSVRTYGTKDNSGFETDREKGNYYGPGKYYLVNYMEPCGRGCCRKYVRELLSKEIALLQIEEELKELISKVESVRSQINAIQST